MFAKGERVVYGCTGVCLITDICEKELIRGNKKLYYLLEPVYQQNSLIYAPVEGGKVFMRHVMTAAEADALILKIPKIKDSAMDKEIGPDELKAAFADYSCDRLVEISAYIYAKKQAALSAKKKLGFVDEKYLHQAENLLFGELSAALGIPFEEVQSYIFKKLGK